MKYPLLIVLFFVVASACCQNDTIYRGVIHIGRKDSTFINVITQFKLSYDPPGDRTSYRDFVVSRTEQDSGAMAAGRMILINARPEKEERESFDYTHYFRTHPLTGAIRLRPGETDTVRFFLTVDRKGNVRFIDIAQKIMVGDEAAYLDPKGKEYKLDVCHAKTQAAIQELTSDPWKPAEIWMLKTHPSDRKEKYSKKTAYMWGTMTVIYSNR